jgi:hypothetical protein
LSNVFLARHLFVTLNGLTSYSFAAVRLDPLFGAMQNNWHLSDENPAMAIRCKAGKMTMMKAGNGNRTRMASLEGWNFTIKLCPRENTLLWRGRAAKRFFTRAAALAISSVDV